MKKRLLTSGLLSALAIVALAGCGNQNKVNYDEILNKQAKLAFSQVGVSYRSFASSDGLSMCGEKLSREAVTVDGFKFSYTYSVTAQRQYDDEYVSVDESGYYLDVIIPEIWELPDGYKEYAAYTLTGNATFQGYIGDKQDDYSKYVGQSFGSQNWNMRVNAMETRPVVRKIADAKKQAEGDLIITRGYVSGYFEKSSANFYTGVFISDGADSLMLYAGSLSNYVNDLEIGTLVQVSATLSPYNGLIEAKPVNNGITTTLKDDTIQQPVWNSWTENDVKNAKESQSGNMIKLENVTIESNKSVIEKFEAGSAWNFDVKVGSTVVSMAINYHMGKDAQNAIKAKLLENYSKSFTFVGNLSWYNKAQLTPIINWECPTTADCFQFAA